ncbi:hypothetical protein ABW19_dt0207776 [Dactylella cylindrospora]|nr:hypothetical protein ABW19_dt0207776 [Dactylella cylindrospora]
MSNTQSEQAATILQNIERELGRLADVDHISEDQLSSIISTIEKAVTTHRARRDTEERQKKERRKRAREEEERRKAQEEEMRQQDWRRYAWAKEHRDPGRPAPKGWSRG